MRIAIVGMGKVGSTLGKRFADAGHEVTFCVRHPLDLEKRALARELNAKLAPVEEASDGELVVLAVPWTSVKEVLTNVGNLAGKPLLDCTNPVNSEFTELTIGHTTSAAEEIARMKPEAKIVKVFNTNGVRNMAEPAYDNTRVTMLYAGDDEEANLTAERLAAEIGFEPVKLGPLKYARLLEPLAMTWIVLSRQQGLGKEFALNLVRRHDV
jgi:8-hydroxy-5-deazaflavin:NADPH oxidoreductase